MDPCHCDMSVTHHAPASLPPGTDIVPARFWQLPQ
jgi:hypothetical protein